MKREDVRDEALGSLLRGAAEFSARERAGSPKIRTPKLLRPRFSVAHRGIAATAAAAVIIAVSNRHSVHVASAQAHRRHLPSAGGVFILIYLLVVVGAVEFNFSVVVAIAGDHGVYPARLATRN